MFHANRRNKCQRNQRRTKGEGWSTANLLKPAPPPPVILLLVVSRRSSILFFGDLSCGVSLFIVILVILYKNIKIGKNRY